MPELPDRPHLDQLRRQARELLRAAANGEPAALTRLRAVSERRSLAVAQLAVAREYGFASWPALRAGAERRLTDHSARAAGAGQAETRWSFGGAAAVEIAAGMLHPGLLIAGPDHATLDASLTVSGPTPHRPVASPRREARARDARDATDALSLLGEAIIGAVTLTDDQAATYALRIQSLSGGPVKLRLSVDPVPARGRSWLELRGQDGSAARLLPSAHLDARASGLPPVPGSPAGRELSDQALMLIRLRLIGADQDTIQEYCSIALARAATLPRASWPGGARDLPAQLTRLCALLTGHDPAGRLPREWSGMLDAAGLTDGARQHLDISAALPPIDDTAVRVDSLISEPDSWHIYLRAEPGWWRYSADGQRKWAVLGVDAQDDLGGRYLTEFGGSARKGDLEEIALRFLPRLNPRARALTLSFAGATEQAALEFRLP